MSLKSVDYTTWKPERVTSKHLNLFIKKHPGIAIVDQFYAMLEELFLLRHPKYRFDKNYSINFNKFVSTYCGKKKLQQMGSWFYFPWEAKVVHFLPEEQHQELRTGRNRNLITKAEQNKFYKATVGILGMSVGSHVALTIVMTGGAKHIKIADPDIISGSNLNRIRTGFLDVGLPKVFFVARKIFEVNPYSVIQIFPHGLDDRNINEFLCGNRKLNLLIEEMDNPYYKVKVRYLARSLRLPVIMAADNGDGIIVDVERFDKNRNLPILHGILGNITVEDLKNIAARDLPKIIAKIAGANLAVPRMLESVKEVGKTLYSWPQLGTAATMCGSVLSFLAKVIILKNKIKSGRYNINIIGLFQ